MKSCDTLLNEKVYYQIYSPHNILYITFTYNTYYDVRVWVCAQSLCPTLCDFVDYSPQGSSDHGISRQAH